MNQTPLLPPPSSFTEASSRCHLAELALQSAGWKFVGHKWTPPATGTEARVCEDIATRQQAGIQKYGQTVSDNPLSLRQWLEHAYQEMLDGAIYLRRAIEMIDDEAECLPSLPEAALNAAIVDAIKAGKSVRFDVDSFIIQ